MIQIRRISLEDCPERFQAAVNQSQLKLASLGHDSTVQSVTVTESTPYKNSDEISNCYRAILAYSNMVSVMKCFDNRLIPEISTNDLIWGDILEILKYAPDESPLAEIRQVVLASEKAEYLS